MDPDDDTESEGRIVTIQLPKKNGREWWTVSALLGIRMKCSAYASMSTPPSQIVTTI